ncbi:MAG: DUF350 domain-containing protein [Betaproteobacteria bacterium]|nr:DUF350 domain-containing protein [Betaproteobacteria bacterium]
MLGLIDLKMLVNSLLYSVLGVIVFWLSFLVIDKVTPHYDLWKEIVHEKNQPLATIIAAMCIGIAIIIASAIH